VIVGNDDDDQAFPVQTGPGVGEYIVELPAGFAPVDRVMIQNATSEPVAPFTLSAIRVETNRRAEPLIVSQSENVDAALRRAARWANRRGLPIYLGEFGAYSLADMDSRVRWTRAVREAAERNGAAWGYWELAAGFGVYDPAVGQFRAPLLDALMD
ncbi:MAG: cellulase family glycosylhydrolase, partial [Phycisphaerales bacterium]|nr:cellulase family glycosylhydrolase [Phycisphaerales bacterium]